MLNLQRMAWTLLLVALLYGGQVHSAPAANNLADAASLLARTTSQPIRLYSTRDFGRERYAAARSVMVAPEKAEALLAKIRSELDPGVVAFIGTQRSLAIPTPKGVELVVAEGATQFDILRVAASDAANYQMQTEDLIRVLKAWDTKFGIDIYVASTDTIQLRLKSMPKDLKTFAREVYKFCPDIVDQGIGTVEKLEQEIARSHEIDLWWD